jgi:hypothetical protein
MPSRGPPQGRRGGGHVDDGRTGRFFDASAGRGDRESMFASESARTFEAMKDDLLRSFPGQYALVCGQRLMGVFASVDEAMVAASKVFEGDDLAAGTPILISEIAMRASVRVLATPYNRRASVAAPASR